MTREELLADDTQYCCYCGQEKVRFHCCGENHFQTFAEMDKQDQDEFYQDEEEHMSIEGTGNVTLVKENEDGSAVYQFDFPPEAVLALTRLGILTAIQAGIGDAKKLHPDYEEHDDRQD